MIGPNEPSPAPANAPAPQPHPLRGMGEVLVMLSACGFRMDQIMGEADFRVTQARLIHLGLLDANGEPTPKGDQAAKAFIDARARAAAVKRAQEEADPANEG